MNGRTADLLVLGGGPAGATLAALAASAGARVVLVERDRFPRDKVCGEFLAPEGVAVVERLGLLPALTPGTPRMDTCLLSDRRGRSIQTPLPDLPAVGREALGLSRARLDHALLQHAARCGVEVRERCEASAPLIEDGRMTGAAVRAVGSGATARPLRATIVAAADGRRSILRSLLPRSAGDPTRTSPRSRFGLKVHLRGDAALLDRRVELHLFDGGYVGLAPVDGDRINVCLVTTVRALHACGGSPDRLLRERVASNPLVAARLAGSEPCGPWHAVGPLRFGPRAAVVAGGIAVGDAAGTIDPFSGEGMSNALLGAELAAPWALRAIERGAVAPEIARGWTRDWARSFGSVTRGVRRLGGLFEHAWLGGPALSVLRAVGRSGLLAALVEKTRTGAVIRPV